MGTFDGRTTLNLSANSPEDSVIFTIDLPKGQMPSARFELEEREKEMIQKEATGLRYSGRAEAGKIVQLYGDTASSGPIWWRLFGIDRIMPRHAQDGPAKPCLASPYSG
ncbi:MAG: hypothetical protein HYU34_02990 [Candidatus Omnitrophica bacterium]|nr:hypothetical protein [Candidatus Omnitrophota bacterium]